MNREVARRKRTAGLREDKLHQWMRSINVEIPTMAMLNNYDGAAWHMKEMVEMLTNPSARANLIRDTVQYAVESHQAGIVVDFERCQIKIAGVPGIFRRAGSGAACVGLKVMIALPARDDKYDYKFFGKQCDAIVLADYDHALADPNPAHLGQDWFVGITARDGSGAASKSL